MESSNNKISKFQFFILAYFLTGSLFVGLGIESMYAHVGRDIWVTAIISIGLSIIPALLFIYIFNYQPDKNIFEKNKHLFGHIIGTSINIILCILVYILVTITVWSMTTFIITMYLTKNPRNVLLLLL